MLSKKPGKRRKRQVMQAGFADRLIVRGGVRVAALGFLALTIGHALYLGDYANKPDSPLYNMTGKFAGIFGQAAQEIRITGLTHHKPDAVLAAINVQPNGSLLGFNPVRARNILQNTDWVEKAKVQRIYPNQLEIDVVERVPFAVWQRAGEYYVIDRSGLAISSVSPQEIQGLLVVTGEGAQTTASDLVNQLEVVDGVKSKVKAAARVGERRWNLYLSGGIKVMLPEDNKVGLALQRLEKLVRQPALFSKAVAAIDLRLEDKMVLVPKSSTDKKERFSSR